MTNDSTLATAPRRRGLLQLLTGSAVLLGGALLWQGSNLQAAEQAVRIPPPAQDAPATGQGPQKAIFAGGCFWGVQGVFQHVKGVQRAVSGYSGGTAAQASYSAVSSGRTGHAESVEVTYDPAQVSYGQLLQIYFSVAHDPTQLNRQGPDSGTQYRSTVFPANDDQRKVAEAYIAQLNKTGVYPKALATTVEPLQAFYPAEGYHQDYLVRHPNSMYIVVNDIPKVENLAKTFPDKWRDKPVLVN